MISWRSFTALLLVFLASPVPADVLPRPVGLEPEIAFWRRVFTEVTSQQALLHDNRHLAVVYEKIDLPTNSTDKQRRRISEKARKRYQHILERLAKSDRKRLTFEERRILALWPANVSDQELADAARRVRFQQGLSDRFREGYVRAGLWKGYIQGQLREAGVPEALVALPHVESSFDPTARSYVGASGLWQFTRSTGRRFMRIDHVVDERRDPFLSSAAAARLLQYNYSILNSWSLAITAYNHGVAGMRRAVKKTGTDDIEVIVRDYDGRSFGFASRNFYVAFLAASEVEQNAEAYFGSLERLAPREEILLKMPDYVAVDALAETFGYSLDTLRERNPALLNPVWSGTKFVPRGFTLRLPAGEPGIAPDALLAAIPAEQRFSAQTPDLQHRVERGDSLSAIAARYGTSVSELMALNNLRSRHKIRIGQRLNLPYRGPTSLAAIPAGTDTYVVQRGDTVGIIAQRADMDVDEFLALNNLPNRNRIYPGQKLLLVAEAETASEATTEMLASSGVEETIVVAAVVEDSAEPPAMVVADLSPPTVVEFVDEQADRAAADAVESDQSAPPAATIAGIAGIDELAEVASQPMVVAERPAAEEVEIEMVDSPVESGESLADPSDYEVSADGKIEVQAAETLGHYADWLDIPTQKLRDLNGYAFRQPVMIGQRLALDFSTIDRGQFTARRIRYHRELQEAFFTRYRITDTTVHRLRQGESLYVLTLRRYKVPIWLLRQYNPDLDLNRVRDGTRIVFPRIEKAEGTVVTGVADAA